MAGSTPASGSDAASSSSPTAPNTNAVTITGVRPSRSESRPVAGPSSRSNAKRIASAIPVKDATPIARPKTPISSPKRASK